MTEQPDRWVGRRTTPLRLVAATGALVLAACSGGGAPTAVRRLTTSSTGPTVLDDRIQAPAPSSGADASRFSLGDGTTVLVPAGALARGAEVRVRRAGDGVGATDGAIEGGPATYEVSVTSGSILKPIAVQVAVPDAPGRTAALAVRLDDATRTWSPANSDAAPGVLTIYAAKPGTYGWVRWSWESAAAVAAQTVRSVVGLPEGSDPALSCGDVGALGARFSASGTNGAAMRWCAGTEGGNDRVQVANRAESPLSLRVTGLSDGVTTRRAALTDGLIEVMRRHWQSTDGEALDVLAPGDRAAFRLTPTVAARATSSQDGLTQYYVALGSAAAFVVGLYAGTTATAAAVLAQDDVRRLILADLDAPGCADTVGTASGAERAAEDVAASTQTLVACVTPATIAAIVTAAGRRSELRAAFANATTTLPATATALLPPATIFGVAPLVATLTAGEVRLTPIVPPPPPPPGPPTSAGGPTTPAPNATTTTVPPLFNTTTAATAPPTTAAPGPTTTQAATTTVAATTTTTRVRTAPVLTLLVRKCTGNAVPMTGTGLTPSGAYRLTFDPPRGSNVTVNGAASAAGSTTYSFSCAGQTKGTWSAGLTDVTSGLMSVFITFDV